MLKLQKISPLHEELFIQHYERLLSWALQLTHSDRGQAEDLLHDAFIQFTVSQPDLTQIRNLDGYLYGTLRNLHLSQVRKATRSRLQQLSIVEYESAETGLRTVDPRDLIHVQDQLRHVCHFVCARKETARTASVLILRFFHGYYPSEIAQVLQTTYTAVKMRLRMARLEAKAGLENPEALSVLKQKAVVEVLPTNFARTAKDFLSELRETVFHSRRGECQSSKQLRQRYGSNKTPIKTGDLAHIVSCETCLEDVNKMLGLPSLADRYPVDSIERDKGPRGGAGGGTGGGARTGATMKSWRRQAREVFEHDPQELCVSVNGYMQSSLRINSELTELTLDIDLNEQIDFIEIFSEQQIRLLLMNIDEPPPEGPGEQSFVVALSQGRTLELNLKFSSPWPTLHVAYHDPTFVPLEVGVESLDDESGVTSPSVGSQPTSREKYSETSFERTSSQNIFARMGHRVRARLRDLGGGFFLRPATVAAVLALTLIGVLLFVQFHRTPAPALTASTLLSQSSAAEQAIAAKIDQVLHRTINLEERKTSGELITRRRIEVWQSADRGVIARRLYDEGGALIAGDWRRADGVQTLYHHGARPQLQLTPEKREGGTLSFDTVWLLSPSAKEFSSLIVGSEPHLEEGATSYQISYTNPRSDARLVRATLSISRTDLRAFEQTVTIQIGDETREYRFTETGFERHAPASVAPAIFEPEPGLLGETRTLRSGDIERISVSPSLPVAAPPVASAELEVEVLQRLNQAGALLGEQVSLTRTSEGLLRVQGIVDTDQRKSEIINALGSVAQNPAVRVDLQTVSEAVAQQKPSSPGTVTLQQLESSKATITLDSELRKYFSARQGSSGEQLDRQIRVFSDQMINRSRQARRHALALKQIAERFSAENIRGLNPAARAQWRALLNEHARICQQEIAALRRELQPIFGSGSEPARAEIEIAHDEDFARAARRLFDLASTSDDAVRTAFSISDESASAARIKSPQFWQGLATIEALAVQTQAKSQ